MNSEERRIIRDGFGAISVELRQRREVDRQIMQKLDALIRMAGEDNGKVQALREDVGALQDSRTEHERKIAEHGRKLSAIAR